MATEEDLKRAIVKKRIAELQAAKDNIVGQEVTSIELEPESMVSALKSAATPHEQGTLKQQPNPLAIAPPSSQVPFMSSITAPGTLGGQIVENAPQIAGGTIGGIVGAAIPSMGEEGATVAGGTALGNYLLGPLGAGIGGAAGRMATLDRTDPQYWNKVAIAAATEGAGELGGRLVMEGVGRTLFRPFRRGMEPGAEAADRMLRESGILPIPATRRGRAGRWVRRTMHAGKEFLEGEPFSETRMAEL